MAIEIASGLFALGGVALAGVLSEIRSVREARTRRVEDLQSLRRSVYAEALRRVEAVAKSVARWCQPESKDDPAVTRAVWDALSAAYEIQLEIHLIARRSEVAGAMGRVLGEYRHAVEENKRVLPRPNEPRLVMINAFRMDLGMPVEDF
jgi:hypothetical protein